MHKRNLKKKKNVHLVLRQNTSVFNKTCLHVWKSENLNAVICEQIKENIIKESFKREISLGGIHVGM